MITQLVSPVEFIRKSSFGTKRVFSVTCFLVKYRKPKFNGTNSFNRHSPPLDMLLSSVRHDIMNKENIPSFDSPIRSFMR
jgi:hypothetical protein